MRILFIDDDLEDHEVFCDALKAVNPDAECVYRTDGIEALKFLREESSSLPDYIFLDLNMPRMGGAECLKALKSDDVLKDVPVILYSTSVHPSEGQKLKELGAK